MFLRVVFNDTDVKASEETPEPYILTSCWDKGVIQALTLSRTRANTELFPFHPDLFRSDTSCKDVSGVLYCVDL